jgi:hypothetical protein
MRGQPPTPEFSWLTIHGVLSGGLLPELLGEPDENSFGTPDVAEPVDVFVIDNFIDQHRTELAEPGECVVDVLNGEHYALVSQRVHRSCAVIGLDGGSVEAREFDAAVAVRGAHHSDLDTLPAHTGDAAGPFSIDRHSAFEGKAEFSEKLNCGIDVLHHNSDVVHTLQFHDVSLVAHRRRSSFHPGGWH